LLEILFVCWR